MANAYVQLPPDSSGQKAQAFNNVVANTNVVCTAVAIVTSAGASCDPPSGTGVALCGNINSNAADSGSPVKVGGVYNSTLPTAASGNRLDIQLDVNGKQLVTTNADGPVSAGTAASKSFLVGGVYNTSLPSPTNGQQVALQLDSSGRALATVSGDTAAAASDAGNPVKVGAVFTQWSSLPAYTTGQRSNLQSDPSGTLKAGLSPLGTPVYGSNNTVAANGAVTITVPAAKMGYLDGFDVDGVGSTSGGAISVTVTGVLGGTLTYVLPVVAGNTTPNPTFSKRFNPPLQASAVNTNFVISVPSFGSGSPGQSLNAYAHYV